MGTRSLRFNPCSPFSVVWLLVATFALSNITAQEKSERPATGADPTAELTIEKLDEKIKEVEGVPELNDEFRKKVLGLLQKARGNLQKAALFSEQASAYTKGLHQGDSGGSAQDGGDPYTTREGHEARES